MIVTIEEDTETGELMLPFPPELLASLGWVEGDTLVWSLTGNHAVVLTKKGKRRPNAISYSAGAYGNFVNWTIGWLVGDHTLDNRPWTSKGNAHGYIKSKSSFDLMHPVTEETKNEKLADLVKEIASNYEKVISISPTANTLIWNINNKFEKIFDAGPMGWIETLIEQTSTSDHKAWHDGYIGDAEPWQIREWLSILIFNQHRDETKFYEVENILIDNVLKITDEDLKLRFTDTIEKFINFLNITVIRSQEEIDLLHNEWLNLQLHCNKDELVKSLVYDIVNDNIVDFPELTLVDESQIQRILKEEHNIHIKCFGLNKWPSNTTELKRLLYKMDGNNEITP